MTLWEIFDYREDIDWQHNRNFELGAFIVNGVQYVVQIERRPLSGYITELKGKKTAEVSFYTMDDNAELAHSTSGAAKTSATRIYGGVSNALRERFADYDAFYFTADKRHSANAEEFEQKTKIYSFISDRVAKSTGGFHYEHEGQTQNEFLVSKIKLSKETRDATHLLNMQQEALRACGFKTWD